MLPEALTFTAHAPLVDIGANLTHDSFQADLDDVIERAHAAGVTTLILTGTDQQGIEDALTLCERDTPVALYATAGLHPHHASDWTPELARFIEQAASHKASVAIGECGLDYHRDYSSRTDQRRALEAQLELAARTGKPLFLHERDAGADMADILGQWRDDITQAVVHCFTGERATLHHYLDLDLHIGLTGWICDERRGHHLRSLIADIPVNRLMIETDCPYLLPRNLPAKLKGRRHEPALLPWIAREIAYWRGVSEQTLSEQTTATARAFFTLPLTD